MEWKNRLHNGCGLMQLTRGLMNSWLPQWGVPREGEAPWRRTKWKDQDYSSGWEIWNTRGETLWLLAWKSSSAAAWSGKALWVERGDFLWWESQRCLYWPGRIPSLHLTVLEGELRTSVMKTALGLLSTCRVFNLAVSILIKCVYLFLAKQMAVGRCSCQEIWFGEREEKLTIRPGCRIWLTSKLL